MLLVYGLLLGVLLPYYVGKWWYGTQRMTREKVLLASAGKLFREFKEDARDGDIVSTLSCGEEFDSILKGNKAESGLGKIEASVTAENEFGDNAAGLTLKDRNKLKEVEGTRRKVLALLWAYLGRIRLDGSTLDDGKFPIIH